MQARQVIPVNSKVLQALHNQGVNPSVMVLNAQGKPELQQLFWGDMFDAAHMMADAIGNAVDPKGYNEWGSDLVDAMLPAAQTVLEHHVPMQMQQQLLL